MTRIIINPRRFVLLPVASAVLALTAGCSGSSAASGSASPGGSGGSGGSGGDGPVRVVASTDVYGDIVGAIGGSAVSVTSVITDPDQDPHAFEADTADQVAIAKAELLVENGGGYDDFMERMRSAAGTRAPVVDVVRLSGKTAPAGGELNEHVWYDVPTVEKLSTTLVRLLSAARPGEAATFQRNASALETQLQGLRSREATIARTATGKGVAITEPVPLYLLQACGLVDRTPVAFSEAVEEGSDVPARVLQQTLTLFSGHEVSLLAYNEQTEDAATTAVVQAARSAGVPVVGVTETLPSGRTYVSWMTDNLAAVSAAVSR